MKLKSHDSSPIESPCNSCLLQSYCNKSLVDVDECPSYVRNDRLVG